MKNIQLINQIATVGTDRLDRTKYRVGADIKAPDAILVRSASLHDMELNPELLAIARCGAGVNNIPIERCSKAGIVVFNTPGANANGVKELTVCALMLAARDIAGGIAFAESLAGTEGLAKAIEKGKSAFVGHEVPWRDWRHGGDNGDASWHDGGGLRSLFDGGGRMEPVPQRQKSGHL